jgi:hypothetical protein
MMLDDAARVFIPECGVTVKVIWPLVYGHLYSQLLETSVFAQNSRPSPLKSQSKKAEFK